EFTQNLGQPLTQQPNHSSVQPYPSYYFPLNAVYFIFRHRLATIQFFSCHFTFSLYILSFTLSFALYFALYICQISHFCLYFSIYFSIAKKLAAVIILGHLIPDSKKSLSPVSIISTFDATAALMIPLSFTSRIDASSSVNSSGICTTSMTESAIAKNRSIANIFLGNFRLNIRRSSSIFWVHTTP
ncbi:hypothetical protein SAMN05216366_1702, partial [Selenomonas ruminantium]